MKTQNDHMLRVMEMMKHELAEYKTLEEEHRTNFAALRKEADTHKRERNVLAHQSTLILQGLSENSDDGSFLLLAEIENLKRTLEDEHNKHEEEINILQERLEVAENNAQVEILEERLKLVESELQAANERARKAEEKVNSPPAPPPLPPPPPPPLLPGCLEPPKVPLRRRRSKPALQELADTIGVQDSNGSEKKGPSAPGVNEDIINAIKAGQFTLRKANKKKEKEEKEEPKAVSEMLNILGSLRCAPKKRKSLHFGKVES